MGFELDFQTVIVWMAMETNLEGYVGGAQELS